jgi:NADPH:quinone reductase-like Zn-dependent oxidoreductase
MATHESRAVVLERPGALPAPTVRAAASPQRNQVLLRVRGSSVNFHDYVLCARPEFDLGQLLWPRVPFSDNSAEVVELGQDVSHVAVGDNVVANFFPDWISGPPTAPILDKVYGDQLDGALQTYMVAEAHSLVRAPSNLSHREAGTLGCAGLTAWRALFDEGRLKPAQVVVIQGTGGVSLFALGFTKMAGATVILTSSSDEKLERGKALGADHLVNYKATPAWDKEVLELTDGRGADIVLDVGGATTIGSSISAVRVGGHVSVIGVLTGYETNAFPFATIMGKNISVKGITVGSTEQLATMCAAIETHDYHPVLDKDFALEEAEGAIQHLLSQRHFGKITLSVD